MRQRERGRVRAAGRRAGPVLSAMALIAALSAAPGLHAEPSAPRQVNLTPDSAPGWVPSEDLERAALKAASDYFAAVDAGRLADAYARQSDLQKQHLSFDQFQASVRAFDDKAGAAVERKITTLTWTKDPAQAPAPGVYAALDLVGRFAKADRYCGYVVLYQAPAGGGFTVMREESNFLDNATARKIEHDRSRAAVDEAWAQVSANCPNYQAPLAEADDAQIGYASVEAALKDLRQRPGVVFTSQDGWTVATEEATRTFWSFPPPGHPAYPAAVKRQILEQDGHVVLQMGVLCGASKEACDDLVRSFQALNAQLSDSARKGAP